MQTADNELRSDQAQQVCISCKTRKRKCDKSLPECSACLKRNLKCEYSKPEESHNSGPAPELPWCGSPNNQSQSEVDSLDFPTISFLDPSILQQGQVDIPIANSPAPAYILRLLGDMSEIHATASKFFEHIHLWMPFISKKRFYEIYLRPSFRARKDVVLLLLSLKLVTTLPPICPRNPRTDLYYLTKHFYLEVEVSSTFSILVLQAGVLIALYELGHGIYPAAFLSIGSCTRYAHALGIKAGKTANTRKVLTLVEVEERRRVWWGIVILDRFVNIGCPGRPFATADPELEDLLPANDTLWDQGIVRTDDLFTLSSPMSGHMSKFALLCQAARLLGQVLHQLSLKSEMDDDICIQIDRTLQSMLTVSLNVDTPDYDQITFIYSALVALHAPWFHSENAGRVDSERHQRAKAVLHQITKTININLLQRRCFLGRDPDDMPPWGLFFAYHICGAYLHSPNRFSGDENIVQSLKEGFQAIDARWNVAGLYLQLLEAREVIKHP